MATEGADEVVLTDGVKVHICGTFGFDIDGACAVASIERRLCDFGNVMSSGCEIELCKSNIQICQPEKFVDHYRGWRFIQIPS